MHQKYFIFKISVLNFLKLSKPMLFEMPKIIFFLNYVLINIIIIFNIKLILSYIIL